MYDYSNISHFDSSRIFFGKQLQEITFPTVSTIMLFNFKMDLTTNNLLNIVPKLGILVFVCHIIAKKCCYIRNFVFLDPFHAINLKKIFMAPFYRWGSTASRLDLLRRGSLLFTTMFPETPAPEKEEDQREESMQKSQLKRAEGHVEK